MLLSLYRFVGSVSVDNSYGGQNTVHSNITASARSLLEFDISRSAMDTGALPFTISAPVKFHPPSAVASFVLIITYAFLSSKFRRIFDDDGTQRD